MRIAIGADHAGFALKEHLAAWLGTQGHDVVDCGTGSTASVDYPAFGHRVATAVARKDVERGVLVCGSGIGMAMAANRMNGVRAVVIRADNDAALSREHNNANVACFGGRMTDNDDAVRLLQLWLNTPFGGGRHERRVGLIDT